jgi:predicted peroxiredoxin
MTLYQSFVLVMILAVIGACTVIFLVSCGIVVLAEKIAKSITKTIRRRKRLRK